MGCIEGTIQLLSGQLKGTATTQRALNAAAKLHGAKISASISLVCIAEKGYLDVQPEYIWLTKDNNFIADVEVISNTYWITE